MIEITWLGHATFKFRLENGEVIVCDPWLDEKANPVAAKHQFDRIDYILVSHGHFDHLGSVVPLAKQFGATVVGMVELCQWVESKGVKKTSGMNKGGRQAIGSAQVTMTHALHSAGIFDDGKMLYGGEPAGFVIHLPDRRNIYFAGDTAVFSDMSLIRELYHPELALLPIGDHYTMGPDQAALACRLLQPKRVIPMHYGTFPILTGTPQQLAAKLAGTCDTEVWELEKGKPVSW
jgi:L-ascorbate metabolism protein UlaG (beta-lactamase superfamily)